MTNDLKIQIKIDSDSAWVEVPTETIVPYGMSDLIEAVNQVEFNTVFQWLTEKTVTYKGVLLSQMRLDEAADAIGELIAEIVRLSVDN